MASGWNSTFWGANSYFSLMHCVVISSDPPLIPLSMHISRVPCNPLNNNISNDSTNVVNNQSFHLVSQNTNTTWMNLALFQMRVARSLPNFLISYTPEYSVLNEQASFGYFQESLTSSLGSILLSNSKLFYARVLGPAIVHSSLQH